MSSLMKLEMNVVVVVMVVMVVVGWGGATGFRPDSEMKPDSSRKKGCFLGV